MKRKHYIAIASILVVIIAIVIFRPGKGDSQKQLAVKVEKGEFDFIQDQSLDTDFNELIE